MNMKRLFRNPAPYFCPLTAAAASTTSITASGEVSHYGDTTGYTYGVAYRTGSGNFTHKAASTRMVNVTITSLSANTEYELKLYAKKGGSYVYGDIVKCKTPAESAE